MFFLLLVVKGEAESAGKLTVSGTDGFPCLSGFCMGADEHGVELRFVEGSMPKLEFLYICFNAARRESQTSGAFYFGIENLPCLRALCCTIHGSGESTDEVVEAAKKDMERAASMHPNHPTLQIDISEKDLHQSAGPYMAST